MKIPDIRDRLHVIANDLGAYHSPKLKAYAKEIHRLADATKRRKSVVPRSPVKSRKMTKSKKDEIRAYKLKNPTLSNQEIATFFKVNHGRVSDALLGLKT